MLMHNSALQDLDVSYNNIWLGIKSLVAGLHNNRTILKINLSHNNLGSDVAVDTMAPLLATHPSLRELQSIE